MANASNVLPTQVHVTDTDTDDDYFEYEHYGTFDVKLEFSNCISDTSFEFTVDIDQVRKDED